MKGLAEWVRLISLTGVAQVAIQLLGILSGIYIIRVLPTEEYALYTLANAMLTTMLVLTDSGIGAGVLAGGGKVWQNTEQLGKVIGTGILLRRKFALLALLLALPVLWYLLIRHDAGWFTALLIILSIIPAFYAALTDTLYEIPLKLNQDIVSLQKNQLLANVSRFLLLVACLFFLPFTFIAFLCLGATRIWANLKLKKLAARFASIGSGADPVVEKEVMVMLRRTLPSTVYYCASGQIAVWLISVFGSTKAIAEVGALDRIVGALGLVHVVFSTLVIPRFARLPEQSSLLIGRFFQILLLLVMISMAICTLFYFFSDQVLFVLGAPYRNLQVELLLITVSGCLGLMAAIVNYLSVARGWAILPALYIPASLVVQVSLVCFLNLSVLSNVLIVSIANAATALLLYSGYFLYRGFKVEELYDEAA